MGLALDVLWCLLTRPLLFTSCSVLQFSSVDLHRPESTLSHDNLWEWSVPAAACSGQAHALAASIHPPLLSQVFASPWSTLIPGLSLNITQQVSQFSIIPLKYPIIFLLSLRHIIVLFPPSYHLQSFGWRSSELCVVPATSQPGVWELWSLVETLLPFHLGSCSCIFNLLLLFLSLVPVFYAQHPLIQ